MVMRILSAPVVALLIPACPCGVPRRHRPAQWSAGDGHSAGPSSAAWGKRDAATPGEAAGAEQIGVPQWPSVTGTYIGMAAP
eukprot:353940-Chlamydomonas_euryale.AAC.1